MKRRKRRLKDKGKILSSKKKKDDSRFASEIHRQTAESLKEIERMALRGEDIEGLGLSFVINVEIDGDVKTIDLMPNGQSIGVT
jgi:hypothetical protein